MKKITLLAFLLIIFNFIYCSFGITVYASTEPDTPDPGTSQSGTSQPGTSQTGSGQSKKKKNKDNDKEKEQSGVYMSIDEYKTIADEGVSTINGTEKKIQLGETDVGSASSKLGTFLTTISATVSKLMSKFSWEGGFYYVESKYSAEKNGLFTISSTVFGEYLLFNPKAYQKSTDLNPNIKPSKIVELMDTMKERGSTLGHLLVQFSLTLALPMIVYAVLKTVSAKKAADVAAWKKILTRWVLCVFLIILFQYILVAIDNFADVLIETFWQTRVQLEDADCKSFELAIEEELASQIETTGGVTSLAYGIEFFVLTILQALFFVKYIVRAIAIIILFIIAPIIILVHSFNLMLGKESDTLGSFFKNYISLVFMQPLHALFYIVFLFSLSELAIDVPILGLILLWAIYRATNIAKAMFGWDMGSSILSGN